MKTNNNLQLFSIISYLLIIVLLYPIMTYFLQSVIELPVLINPEVHVIITFISGPLILLISAIYIWKWKKKILGVLLLLIAIFLIIFLTIELNNIA